MLSRALIVLLVVLNAGVALWWVMRPGLPVAPAPEAPTGVARLQLLSEVAPMASASPPPATPALPGVPTPPVAAVAGSAATAAPRCFTFGPFANAEALAAARAVLRPLAATQRTRELPPAGGRGWQVVLPPLADLAAAQAMAERIKAAGFTDLFVMRDGDAANGIALGRYGSEGPARQHEAALRAAGFQAQAQALGGARSTWLDVATVDGTFDPVRVRGASGAAQADPIDCAGLR